MRHLSFHEMLASTDPSSELWRVTAAGLHTLRLVETWRRGSRRRSRVSTRQIRAVAGLVKAAQGGAQRRLRRVIDAIDSNEPDAEVAVAAALLEHARALRLEMEWQLAIDVCETIAEKLGKNIDRGILLEAIAQWAVNLRLVGRFDEAHDLYIRLRRDAKRFQNPQYVIRGNIGLANILMERGNYPEAQSVIDEVIAGTRLAADARLQGMLSRAVHTRSNVAHARGQYAEAVAMAYEALALCDDAAEREGIVHDIAAALASLGCLSAARDALVLLRRTAMNRANRWSASVNLMEIAALEGRAESFEAWRRELDNHRLRPWHRAQFLYLAGEGYERLEQYERALAMYEAAVFAGEALGINEVVIRAEARVREVHAKRYLPALRVGCPVPRDVEHVIEAVAELRIAAGISVGGEDP